MRLFTASTLNRPRWQHILIRVHDVAGAMDYAVPAAELHDANSDDPHLARAIIQVASGVEMQASIGGGAGSLFVIRRA